MDANWTHSVEVHHMLLQNCFKVRITISMSAMLVAYRGRKRMRDRRKEALGDGSKDTD